MLLDAFKHLKHKETFQNVMVILAVYGVHVVLFKDIFRCPCGSHKSYGMSFLFVPTIFLFGFNLIISQRSLIIVTTFLRHSNYKTKCNYFLSSLVEIFRPFFAPASWIIVTLLRGECYVCIRVGPDKQCISDSRQISEFDFDHYYSQSFILGSACLVSVVIFAIGIVCIQRFCTNNYEHLPTYDDLIRAKRNAIFEAFKTRTRELANEHAEKVVESSFSVRQGSELDVDERFIQAREKALTICGQKLTDYYMIEVPYTSMEITSSSTM